MATLGNCEDTAPCQHFGRILARLSDKWTLVVVGVLERGPSRFNALRREIGEVSQKVLASTLQQLEENGLVSRTVSPTKPPQVEYALTDLGRDFCEPVRMLAAWAYKNSDRLDEARAKYAMRATRN